jgi:glycopeptide antibiotics resistance protein
MNTIINTDSKPVRGFLWFVLLAYMLVLVKLIIFKWPFPYVKEHFLHHYSWELARLKWKQLNLIPFYTIKVLLTHKEPEYTHPAANLLGNIVGFIPLGLLIPLLFKRLRTARATILRVFLISLGFEVVQLLILLGYFDVDDLLLNTIGGAIGYMLFALMRKRL